MATQDSAPPAAPNNGPEFVTIFGPIFWGFCVSLVLSGVTVSQSFIYFTRYSDKLLIRCLATFMVSVPPASSFPSIALIQIRPQRAGSLIKRPHYAINLLLHGARINYQPRLILKPLTKLPSYGSLGPLGAVTSELDIDCGISSIIAFMSVIRTSRVAALHADSDRRSSQMFFVYQLVIVASNSKMAKVMNVAIVVSGTISLGASIGCVVIMFEHPGSIFMHRTLAFNIFAGMHKANGAIADVLATTAMFMFLKTADTGIRRTSSLLRSLTILVVNRGLLVTLAQVVGLIVLFASTTHLYWVAVHINTTRLYVATFFAMLNYRTPPEATSGPQIAISGTRRDSFDVTKFPDYHSDGKGIGVRVQTTSTVAEL
ncbi:hypothetical protein B0H19DRAFT_1277355 [Mycena capillaripes]|nr:hypothetical protein B0H19DRAFT_1277355 [Mycena capillaripes]